MNDHFLLRGTFGAPYEFLWANPYQPGLSYFQAPLVVHDSLFGRFSYVPVGTNPPCLARILLGRTADVSRWRRLRARSARRRRTAGPGPGGDPIRRAHTEIQSCGRGKEPVFVVGLKPRRNYLIEIDDEELCEQPDRPGRHPASGRAARYRSGSAVARDWTRGTLTALHRPSACALFPHYDNGKRIRHHLAAALSRRRWRELPGYRKRSGPSWCLSSSSARRPWSARSAPPRSWSDCSL